MWIQRLYAKNFRNYSDLSIEFDKGVNVIIGENGQGKTNLLEAIHFAATGRSFRTEKLSDLIHHAKEETFTHLEYDHHSIEQSIKIQYGEAGKKILVNQTSYPSFSSLTGTVPTITIAPCDIALIMGSPQERRRFLNLLIAQHDPFYLIELMRYQKALKARNILLKRQSRETIKVYETLLAQSATFITKARLKAVETLSSLMQSNFLSLTGKNLKVSLNYSFKNTPSLDYFLEQFNKHREQEEKLGNTLSGPHRDDFLFLLQEKEAKLYASEGQKRALLIALKLAEMTLLKISTHIDPILFIDDFAIHLDLYRCQLFEELIQTYPQVFITTPQNLFEEGTSYLIQEAKIEKLIKHLH
jgi:DNA replication and repair protein RecF